MIKKPYSFILYAIAAIGLLVFLYIESQGQGDFFIFLSASGDLFKAENIFEKTYVNGYHYFYSVFFAILLHPFVFLPFQLSKFIWLAMNVFFVYRIFIILKNLLPLHNLSKKQLMLLRYLGFLFAFRFIYENLHHSQSTILLLYLSLQGLQWVVTNKVIPGAALIALGINIKLLPIVLLPYLIYRRFFGAAAWVVVFYAVFMFAPALFIGMDHNSELLNTWLTLVNPTNSNHVIDVDERSFHGLSTLLSTLLIENPGDRYAMNIPRNIANISPEQLGTVLNIVRLALIAFSLYFFRTAPFKPARSLTHQFREIAYLLLLVPLIFPHQQHYAFLFICPAFVFCLYYLIRNKSILKKGQYYFLLYTSVLVYLLCALKILLGEFNHYYEHFKILTWGALLLIVMLAVCQPPKEEINELN